MLQTPDVFAPFLVGDKTSGCSSRKKPGWKNQPGWKVWERMPERHFAYAESDEIVQVRNAVPMLHSTQLGDPYCSKGMTFIGKYAAIARL